MPSSFATTCPCLSTRGHHLSQDLVHTVLPRGYFSGGKGKDEGLLSFVHELEMVLSASYTIYLLRPINVDVILNLQMWKLRLLKSKCLVQGSTAREWFS